MQLQPELPIEEIRQTLQKRKNQLVIDYKKVSNQIMETIDEVERSRLDKKANGILKEITEVSDQLDNLNVRKPDLNRRYLRFQQDLPKIDFDKAGNKIEQLIRQFRKGVRGDALLLVQESLSMAGELCITEIKARFSRETGDFKHIEFEFSPTTGRLDKIGLLDGLAQYLGITFTQDIDRHEKEYIQNIIQKLCHSLQGGSIVFLEIRKWDALPSQEKELLWFVSEFWIPLIEQLEIMIKDHPQVKFIAVIVADAKLSSECLKLPFFCSNEMNLKIIKLPLQKWSVNDIKKWLESYPGLKYPHSTETAEYIHKTSKKGTPAMVCTALSQIFLK